MALTQVNSAGIADGAIVDADLNNSAAISFSKLASTGSLASAITATTQSSSDNSTKLATTAFVSTAVTNLIGGAPGALDTLNELAAAINDDSSYASTVTTALATKAVLTGSTNNTIATVTGANTLQGEASLTFDGTDLKVTKDLIPTLHAQNTNAASYSRVILNQSSGSGGYAALNKLGTSSTAIGGANATQLWCTGDAPLVFGVNNTERLRITSGGDIHCGDWGSQGTTYGKARLNIRGADEIATSFNLANSYLHIGGRESTLHGLYPISFGHTKSDSTKASSYIGAKVTDSASYEATALVFATRNVTTDSEPTERLRLDANGDLGLGIAAVPQDSGAKTLHIHHPDTSGSTARAGLRLTTGISGSAASNGGFLGLDYSNNLYLYNQENGSLRVGTNGIERLRIFSDGKVTINPYNTFHSPTHHPTLTLSNESENNLYEGGKWSHAAIGLNNTTHTANGGSKSQIVFGYLPRAGGYDFEYGSAYIGATSVSQVGAGKVDLVFGTKDVTDDTQPTERFRIHSDGNITAPTTSKFAAKISYQNSYLSAGTKIPFTPTTNEGSDFSDANDNYTAPVDGFYCFWFFTNVHRTGGAGYFHTDWYKNGSNIVSTYGGRIYGQWDGGWENHSGFIGLHLDAGDYVSIHAGDSSAKYDGNTYGQFMGWLVG